MAEMNPDPSSKALDDASDEDLLRWLAAGQRAAFDVLYRRYYRRLFGFVARWLRNESLIEEVIDDVLLVVYHDAAKFAGRSRPSTWIFGIAWRQAMRALERQVETVGLDQAPERVTPAFECGRGELRSLLDRALALLSPEQRLVVELTYFEECSYAEIAEIAQCPVNTVKTRMFHARQRLRQLLPQFGWVP